MKQTLLLVILPLLACSQTPFNLKPPVPPPSQQAPRAELDRISLSAANPPASQLVLTYTLSKAPIPNSAIQVCLRSSVWGESLCTSAKVDPAMSLANQRTVLLTLPTRRPFELEDVIDLAYLTLEP